jgi:hypothetical protein
MKKFSAQSVYYIRSAALEFNSGLIFTSIWVLYYSVMKLSLVEVSLLYIVITISNLVWNAAGYRASRHGSLAQPEYPL